MNRETISMRPRNLFLIGYRGTGKTTVARLLADQLGWYACDTDDLVEQRAGASIRQIFATEGESGFRQREAEALAELCQQERQVIATGGGVVLAEANRQRLLSSGLVVWLEADPQTIWTRLCRDVTTANRRPDLTVGGQAEIEQLLRVREPLYRESAAWHVDTRAKTPAEVAAAIVAHWQKLADAVQRNEP